MIKFWCSNCQGYCGWLTKNQTCPACGDPVGLRSKHPHPDSRPILKKTPQSVVDARRRREEGEDSTSGTFPIGSLPGIDHPMSCCEIITREEEDDIDWPPPENDQIPVDP